MSELEFRTDDIERAQIRERNILLAKSIVSKVGISTDNPLYKDFLVQTVENVHNVFRFAYYNDVSESTLIELLKENMENVEAYKTASFAYKKELVEQQVFKATGSTFGSGVSYEGLYQTIRETIQSGMEMRKEFGTEFPDIFYDEEGNLRERLVVEIPKEQQESSAMGMIAEYARMHVGIMFDKEKNSIVYDGKPIGPVKFFANKAEKLEKFIKQFEANADVLDLSDEELMKVVLEGDYEEFNQLRAKRGKEGNKKNLALRNALADPHVFEDTQERLSLHEKGNVDSFMHYLKEAMIDYVAKASLVKKEADKDTIENIDRIMFTINPYDVATQSTFRDWNSCMHAVGCNHKYVDDSIGMGSIVAYGYDSINPSKMVSRLLIHPFTNEKGEVAYNVNPRIYGHENIAFRKIVQDVVNERLNKDKKGVFCFNRRNSIDGRGTLYNDGGLQEFYLFSPDERGCVDFRNFGTKKFNFSNKDISGIKKIIFDADTTIQYTTIKKNTEIEFADKLTLNSVKIEQGTKFRGEGDIYLSGNVMVQRGVEISQPVYLSGQVLDCADLSGIDNLIINGAVKFRNYVRSPKNVSFMKVNNECVIEENIPLGLDLSKVEGLCLKNINYIDSSVKLPKELSVRGNIREADLRGVEKVILNDVSVGYDVFFPENVFATGNITDDLSKIENVVYIGNLDFSDRFMIDDHPKKFKFADGVEVSGHLFGDFDFSNIDSLTIPSLGKVDEGVKFPKKVKINETRADINSADFTDVEYLEINSGRFEGENVKFAGHVKISKSNITGCDFSKVDVLEVGERVFIDGETKLPQYLTIKGRLPHLLNLSGVKKLIADVDVFRYNGDSLPEELVIKRGVLDSANFNGVKKLSIYGTKKIDCDCSKIDFMELSNEDKEFEFGNSMKLPKKLKLPHGSTIKGYLQTKDGVDISDIENLTLVDCNVNGAVHLPEDIRVSGNVFSDNDYSSCKNMTLFGDCKLSPNVKYPETLKVSDNTTLSGTIPAGLDLSEVKGLVLSGEVRIGEGVKLPKDVKFEKIDRISGYIPDGTDLSNVDDLTVGNSGCGVIFGKDVKLPDNCKYCKGAKVSGYIPENIDYSSVEFENAIFTGHIPDGIDVGDKAKLEGEVTVGKDIKFWYNTDFSQAIFLGDVCGLSNCKGVDFSKANSVVLSSEMKINKDIKLPENGNVTFGNLVLADDTESILMISKYNLDNTVIAMEAIDKGMSLPNNVMFVFLDEDEKCYGVCPKGCEDKMKALLSEQLDTVEYLSYDELHERFGVNIIDIQKEKEKQSTIADIKSRLAQKGVGVKSEGPDDKSSASTPKVNSSTISINDGISI